MSKPIPVHIIRTDDTEAYLRMPYADIAKAIGAPQGLDTVNLRDGRVMLVDDYGYETETVEHPEGGEVAGMPAFKVELRPTKARRPVNRKATELYHGICIPGTTHQIVGDVAIVWDKDFE